MLRNNNDCRDFSRMLEARQRESGSDPSRRGLAYNRVMDEVTEAFRGMSPERRMEEISLLSLYEETVPDGVARVREMRNRKKGVIVSEAGGDANTTANFSQTIGQISYSFVLDAFEDASLIGGDLLTVMPATTQQREMVPGVTRIDPDSAGKVGEGENYPLVEIGEEYVTLPELDKQGFIIAITEELVMEDKTNLVMERAQDASTALAITRDKDRLNTVLGITASYSRNGGPRQPTYANSHTQGDFDNLLAGNAIVDFTSIDAVFNVFQDMTDPDTGEPIAWPGTVQMVYPFELRSRVNNVLEADFIRIGAISSSVPLFQSSNPIRSAGREVIAPLTSPYVKLATSSNSTWFLGDFKGAFVEREQIPLQLVVEDRLSSHKAFEADIIFRQKVRYKSSVGVRRPQKVVKSTAP